MERRKVCLFCNRDENNELLFGKIYELDDIVTHYYCLLLSSNMEQNGEDDDGILGFLKEDIIKEYKRGRRLICWYCKRSGATLGCCVAKCKKVFHLPCGHQEGSLHQFFGQFKSYCVVHRPVQKIDPQVMMEVKTREATCTICYDNVQPTNCHSTLWAPCCRINAWFHRDCIQKLAMSAGYFFKCPLCNNKTTFQKAMLDFGIYIPEQDASWELVPNAFQELLHQHDCCDARQCLCPKGRFHSTVGTRWELVLCRYCGSQGIHVGCGSLKWSNPEWQCEECNTMLKQAQEQGDTDEEDEADPTPNRITESPPRRKRRYNGKSGVSQRPQCHNDIVSAPSSDVSTSSSQSPGTPESNSLATAVIEVSDDDVIEIFDDDDDDDDLPVKRTSQDNRNMIVSSDGVAIPVIKVESIPSAKEGQNFCVVGGLNVKVPGAVKNTMRNRAQHPSVSQVITLNTRGEASRSASILGANSSGLSVEGSKPLNSTSAVNNSNQSSGSAPTTRGICLLKSYLMSEGVQRGYPHTDKVSAVMQQANSQPLARTTSVLGERKCDQNPDGFSGIQHSGTRTSPYNAAVASSSRTCDRPYRVRYDRHQNRNSVATDLQAQRESRHSVPRVIRSDFVHNDFQFRVSGPNTLQVVFFNRYVVSFDLQLPRMSRPPRKTRNRSASSLQNGATAISNNNDYSRDSR